jgi:acyl-CoA reductase-like NAD-dependent aldehyde dehydrogenase
VAKIAFTGSAATARKVMAAARTPHPVLAECGGKDALLVAADADLEAAADAAAWGAMSNAGQTCIGIERVYVADAVYHSFLERLTDEWSRLRPGSTARPRTGR